MKIYYIEYRTEGGDQGQEGCWKVKPTTKQATAYLKKIMPDCFEEEEDGTETAYIYFSIKHMKLKESINKEQ